MCSGIAELASDYDGFLLDLWGVIHDGVSLYPGVIECLERLDSAGKTFLMLSNAPRRASAVAEAMALLGVPAPYCGHVMSSGEAAYHELLSRRDPWFSALGRRCLHIGPVRDHGLFEGLGLDVTKNLEEADFILNTGPWEDGEAVADYDALLRSAVGRTLPMVCANPDLEVIRGGRRIICAGALALRYEELGGDVRSFGKPYPSVYLACLERLRGDSAGRILAVGDSLRTDIAGAIAAGIDSALVTGGLHADELGIRPGETVDGARLEAACMRAGQMPTAAIPAFNW